MNENVTIKNALNALNIEISYSAHVFLDERWRRTRVCDSITRLYYVRSGKGFLECSGERTEMTGGKMYIIPSGVEFSYGCEELEKIYFHVSVSGVEKYDLLRSVKKIYALPFSENDYLKLLSLYNSDNYLDLLEVKLILYRTVMAFAKQYDFVKIPVVKYSETVRKTMKYIQDNLKANIILKDISAELFISESKIRQDFKKEMGVTIGRYIDDLIFTEAKKLLERRDLSIKEISEKLGFCDRFYFSRRFKEQCNKTPSQYKREISII